MSILDFPRFFFRGQARVNVPTGNRNTHRQIDTSSNCVLLDGQPVDISQPPQNFHQRMRTLAPRYGVDGHAHAQGVFSQAAGYNHGGNNHYAWENVRISGVQLRPDCVETQDRLVGARLALWGHYNDYLRTSFNRARWVELDPSRADAVQIYAGQMTLSAADADPNTPALFSADIGQPHAARWVQDQHIVERSSHILDREFGLVRQFQFSVAKHDPYFLFGAQSEAHPSLEALRLALEDRRVQGLTVQYALFNMSTPQQPDAPVFYDLSGCLGLWCEDELATWPTGRLLLSQQTGLGPVRLIVRADHVSLNMMTAIPFTHRAPQAQSRHQPTHALGGKLPLGELQVLTACGDVIARLPESLYLNYWQHHGVMDLPLLQPVADGGLRLQSVRAEWREEESEVQCETANLYLEAPDHQRGIDFPIAIPLYGAFRGRTAELDLALYVEHPERLALKHAPGDRFGQSTLTLTGLQPGITRVRFGASACAPLIHVRVLPDDWHLNDVPAAQVDYAFLYHHVLSYYELIYPFMSDKVFSLAERCKCETHARLMWQMCDPQNRDKSYYMPSTRELSQTKARLFLKYLEHVETAARVASAPVSCEPAPIASKAALVSALKKAVDLELTIMLQYLYAGYAIPNYAQGQQRVAQGQWSEAQLGLACGGGERRRDGGIRGTLMEVAHEEMIHYLVVNNLLMALGEPFYPGQVRLGQQAQDYFGLDTEFAFEAFSAHVLARFVRYEWPSFIPAPGDTIGSFYRSIRQAFVSLSGLFDPLERKRGGEHHLFLNELTNRAFPAYQLEVFDTASALFAIDFVTDQGEGCALQSPHFAHSHFQRLRAIASRLAAEPIAFEPALPCLKNPTLAACDGGNLVRDADARSLMQLYQSGYELMFLTMGQHFAQSPANSLRRSRLMNAAIDMMAGLLRPLSSTLMNMPSGIVGRHAGPPIPQPFAHRFIADYRAGCHMLAKRCCALAEQAHALPPTLLGPAPAALLDDYHQYFNALAAGKLSREA